MTRTCSESTAPARLACLDRRDSLKIHGTAGNRGARAARSPLPHPVASFREDGRAANDTRDIDGMSVERALLEAETHLTGEPRHRTLAWKLTGLLLVIFYIGKL